MADEMVCTISKTQTLNVKYDSNF